MIERSPTASPPDASREGAKDEARPAQPQRAYARFFAPNYDVNHSARLFQSHYENVWDSERDQNRHPRWMDSMGGRLAMRLFSRGVMGAAFLTAGNYVLSKYVPASALSHSWKLADGTTVKASEYLKEADKTKHIISKALHPIAKSYDVLIGRPIEYLFGKEAVTFRRQRDFAVSSHYQSMGRTYGEEAVAITLDFALGSIGDAWGRRIAGILDPNVKKSWLKEDGHIDWKDFAKSTGKAAFDILSYNQAEDWFAAIPYVYQMKGQRLLLDRYHRGARLAISEGSFGGAFEVDQHGKIRSDYAIAGAVDLHFRFTGYNVYTLLYRDLFQHVKHVFEHRKDEEKPHHERGFFSETGKYLAKTAIKATTYMTPAMPFFWIPRVSSARAEGSRIFPGAMPEQDAFVMKQTRNADGTFARGSKFSHFDRKLGDNQMKLSLNGSRILRTEEYSPGFSPFSRAQNHTAFSAFLRPFGIASDVAGTGLAKVAQAGNRAIGSPFREAGVHEAMHRYFNNAYSYTPYMMAKYETANWWDTPQMDASIYRVLDGLDHGKWSEVKAGVKDYWQVLKRKPVSAETEAMTYEPRGLINSQRHGQDSENRRDGRLQKSFADTQRENRIARRKAEQGQANDKAPIQVDAATAQVAQQMWTTPDARPDNQIQPKNENGWQAYEISRLQQRERGAPPGATVH